MARRNERCPRRVARSTYAAAVLEASRLAAAAVAVTAKDVRHVAAYMEAHALIPPDFDLRNPEDRVAAEASLHALSQPETPPDALALAVVVLGHSPTSEALEALVRHGRSRRPFAGIARVASTECAAMIAANDDDGAPLRGAASELS